MPNRLIDEKSPYLLQHADNPVHWYAWTEEAFTAAKEQNKPIFLSIGYSTCHWCHVMAHESFEDAEVASILNDRYIAIKVDREERPDIDSIYMKVCQMMTGHGGWPLSIFMTPDKIPFYAGTYFPKHKKYEVPGFVNVLQQLSRKFTEDPKHIIEVTKSVQQALQKSHPSKGNNRISKEQLNQAYHQLGKSFDFEYGGFGKAPKFPMPHNLIFLMRHAYLTKNTAALKIAESSLQSMAAGGIYDHIGFGFSRYATDKAWLVPHFEKMLYDNALLLIAYAECYQITQRPFYKKIGEEIITFILREMTDEKGAFYSAIDADSEGVEGKYYVWSYQEVMNILDEDLGEIYTRIYDISPNGNFAGKNIPNLIQGHFDQVANELDLPKKVLEEKLEEARQKLFAERQKRTYPHVDDKVLTSWNGLMIAGLAKAGKIFQNQKYINAAIRAVRFIENHLFHNERLMARYRAGETKYPGYIDDYAFLLWGYVELYEATFDLTFLHKSKQLAEQMLELFWDNDNGGLYFTGKDSEKLITKDKEVYDGAIPSGNSVAAVMLIRIGYLTGETNFLDHAEEMHYTFYEDIDAQPSASPFFLQSVQLFDHPTKEVVIIGLADDPKKQAFIEQLQQMFLPDVSVLSLGTSEQANNIADFASVYNQINQETTIYICENFSCQRPTTNIAEAIKKIRNR
ncbi:MAG: thioredoxin domain-containing protein [Bacillota bacterium]